MDYHYSRSSCRICNGIQVRHVTPVLVIGSIDDEDKDIITRIYCNRISDVEQVNSFLSVTAEFDNENRKYSLKADIDTTYGIIDKLEVLWHIQHLM